MPCAVCRIWSILLLLFALARMLSAAEKPGRDLGFTLQPLKQFFQVPAEVAVGACSAVAVNSRGEVYVFHRGPKPILCFNAEGELLRSWGDDVVKIAHGLRIDRDDNVWVTDVGGHRVYQFDPQGKLLLALGTGQAGAANDQFNQPTDIAFGPQDEVYISDGYGNSRVMKFSTKGQLQTSWGTPGNQAGQFQLPHSILVDAEDRVLVGDRENNRIQVFDADGKWLASWNGFAPYGMAFDADGQLFVADGRAGQVLLLDEKGKVRKRWGRTGNGVGQFQMPHMLGFNADGDLFVAEVNGRRVQKFVRKVTAK